MKDITGNGHYTVYPIAIIRTGPDGTRIEVAEPFRPALKELGTFSHANVLWWCHETSGDHHRETTRFTPPFEAPELGVFASGAPMRPNPIALSTVRLTGLEENEGIIEIAGIDAFDGTPVLDIKPYMPFYSQVKDPSVPAWAAGWPEWMPPDGPALDQKPK